MADSIRIGRLVYSDAEPRKGTLKGAPGDGDTITITALLEDVTTADLILWRNLASNEDESWVPVALADRPDLDGWYRVTAASVEQAGDMDGDGAVEVSATLLRSPSSERPIAELTLLQNERTNEYGFTGTGDGGCVGIPLAAGNTAPAWLENPFIGAAPEKTLALSNGDQIDLYRRAWVGREMARYTPRAAADWYSGAPTLTVNDLPVIGRRAMWSTTDIEADTDWVLDNGLVRITCALDGSDNPTKIGVQRWLTGGNAWSTAVYFEATSITASNPKINYWPAAVLINTPVLCGVRLVCTVGAGIAYATDITLRRGALMAEIVYHQPEAVAIDAFGAVTPEAATDVSDGTDVLGLRATAANADSLYWVIATNESAVTDNANGQVEPPFPSFGAYVNAFGLGLTDDVGAGDDTDNALGMCTSWMYPVGERLDIVGA